MTLKGWEGFMRDQIIHKYEGDPDWKAESDRLFGPNEASALWHTLEDAHIIPPPEKDVAVLSVSANVPTHELAMFRADLLTRKGKSKFIVGDMARLSVHPFIANLVKPYTSELHTFDYVTWDATKLPIPDNSTDILFDRKGALWHIAQNFGDPDMLIGAFDGYYKVLKPGGSVVVDNIGGYTTYIASLPPERKTDIVIKSLTNVPLSEVYPDAPMQYEPSTIDVIARLALDMKDNRRLIEAIEGKFDITELGEGVLSVKLFTKKSS